MRTFGAARFFLAFGSSSSKIARMNGPLARAYIAIATVVSLLLAAAMIVSDRPIWKYFDLASSYMMVVTLLLPPLIWLSWVGMRVLLRRVERPSRLILRVARRHSRWLLRGTLLAVAIVPTAKAFSALKQQIPHIIPFYADPTFAQIDRWMFFGTDPWRLTHAMFGPLPTVLIDRLYLLWFPLALGLSAWYCFTRDQRLQVRGILSWALTWFLLGTVAAVMMSSVGPCFYELYYGDTRFRPLLDVLSDYDEIYQIEAFNTMNWLYENRDQNRFGSGISAMPSLHVGIAFLTWLTARHALRSKWIKRLVLAYALIVWFGSVHLGWHYFIDGLFSVVGVTLIWWAAGKFVDWCERSSSRKAVALVPSGAAA